MLLNKFMTWKPDPCRWGSKMWTDEAICPKSRKGWVTKLRIKAQPLSPMWLASSQGDPFSNDWKITELLSKCFQHELSKTQQMGFFTLWLMKAWHMAWQIKSSLPAVHIYKITFISAGLVNKQDIFHPWKALSVCMCKLATTTKKYDWWSQWTSSQWDSNSHNFLLLKRKSLFYFTLQTSGFIVAIFLCSWQKYIHNLSFCFMFIE